MKISTLIGSDKGGVGKSLLAQIIVAAHDQAGIGLKVVEIDHQRKLSSIFGDRIDLSISPLASSNAAMDAVGLRSRGGFRFDEVYDVWPRGNCLTDLGANITSPLFEWMERSNIVRLAETDQVVFRYVAVAGPDDQALRAAQETLTAARRVLGQRAELFLILNDPGTVAGFAPYQQTPAWRDLHAIVADARVTSIQLPACVSGVMEWGRAYGWSLIDLLDPKSGALPEIQRVASYNAVKMQEHVREFQDWIAEIQRALTPLFTAMMTGEASETRASTVVPMRSAG